MEQKKVFISYSWDSDEHQQWVSKLAEELERLHDFHVVWDGYDLDSFIDKNLFMEESVAQADFTIVVATENYFKKANGREGGVGIETYLNSARHWASLLETKRTNSIVVLREKDSTPTYLAGHFYVDFTDDRAFPHSISTLISKLKEKPKYKRPAKQATASDLKVYQLTKAADIIGIGARNRKCLITEQEGTDFSSSNRIKFELWETKTPTTVHILALHNNVNISQTLGRAAELIVQRDINISNLTILRPKEKRKNTVSIDKLLAEKSSALAQRKLNLTELTYDEYVWSYCIDESFKSVQPPDAIDFYTTQELKSDENVYESAVDHLLTELMNETGCSPQLVIGGGGIGKTSLSLSLAKALITQHSNNVLTILIRSEDIRKYVESTNAMPPEIVDIYDVYVLQAKHLKHTNLFDKKTFDLSIVSGNIAIIIDGLDELTSIFKESFNLRSFLDSISSHHTELGYGRVLLTTRDTTLIKRNDLDRLGFKSYELLGFKEKNCTKYLRRRFAAFGDMEDICAKIMRKVNSSLFQSENRIVPFFVDVIANIFEESLEESGDSPGFELNLSLTPYPSLNEITDHIIYSIFEREKVRHGFNIEPSDYVELFAFLNQEHGECWEFSKVQEAVDGFYGDNGKGLADLIKKHPLIKAGDRDAKFKYDFLHSYLNSIKLLQGLTDIEFGASFARSLARPSIESTEIRDIVKFFKTRRPEFSETAEKLIENYKFVLKGQLSPIDRGVYIGAIENILLLIFLIKNSTKETFTQDVKSIYKSKEGAIEGLYIKGDLPAFDFSNTNVINSRFKNYPKFLASDFDSSSFIYTEFIGCHNDVYRNSNLLKGKIDQATCSIGDLAESLAMLSQASDISDRMLVDEAIQFLSSFYRNSGFRDNNKVHIRFSNRILGLKARAFQKLLAAGYLTISAEKEVDTFYAIGDGFKSSVRKFINDGYKDAKMKKFLLFISA